MDCISTVHVEYIQTHLLVLRSHSNDGPTIMQAQFRTSIMRKCKRRKTNYDDSSPARDKFEREQLRAERQAAAAAAAAAAQAASQVDAEITKRATNILKSIEHMEDPDDENSKLLPVKLLGPTDGEAKYKADDESVNFFKCTFMLQADIYRQTIVGEFAAAVLPQEVIASCDKEAASLARVQNMFDTEPKDLEADEPPGIIAVRQTDV